MSLLFAILFALLHKTDEFAEQIRAVLRTRCAFGVILHTEYLILFAGNTLDRIIEYVYMCYGEIGVFNAFGIYRVIVILACDLDLPRKVAVPFHDILDLSKYENGIHEPSAGTIHCLSIIFGVSADYLMCKSNAPNEKDNSADSVDTGLAIKIFSRYNHADGGDIEKGSVELIPSSWVAGGHEFFGLRITGSELAPRYYEGDVIIFERRSKVPNDSVGLVSMGKNDAFLCHIVRKRNGKAIIPLDRRLKETFYTTEELEASDVHIIGVAIQVRRME